MNKITASNLPTRPVNNLNPGDMFQYKGKIYMLHGHDVQNNQCRIIDLYNGSITSCEINLKVEQLTHVELITLS